MGQLSDGLSMGVSIADGLLEAQDIKPKGRKIVPRVVRRHKFKIKKIMPFLGAIASIFGLEGVMGDSQEVQRIDNLLKVVTKGFQRLETKMDRLKIHLDSLVNEIKREHFWTRLDPDLKKLYQVNVRVNLFYNAPDDGVRRLRRAYFTEMEYSEVYDAFTAIKGIFEGNLGRKSLCDQLITFTETDLKKVKLVSDTLYTRLMQATLDLVRMRAIVYTNEGEKKRRDFMEGIIRSLTVVEESMVNCQTKIRSNSWKLRWKIDADNYFTKNDVDSPSRCHLFFV